MAERMWLKSEFGKRRKASPTLTCKKKRADENEQSANCPWIDVYAAKSVSELIVQKSKIRQLQDAVEKVTCAKLGSPRVLIISGPSGCGKTLTLRLVCKDLNYDIIEWQESTSAWDIFEGEEKETQSEEFANFLFRATIYSSVVSFGGGCEAPEGRVVLVKDIPNALVENSESFKNVLLKVFSKKVVNPIVFVVTDQNDSSGLKDWRRLFEQSYMMFLNPIHVTFNPITSRTIAKALREIVNRQSMPKRSSAIDIVGIAELAQGDIRLAINNMQFAYGIQQTNPSGRDTTLGLFRSVGKFMYGKLSPADQCPAGKWQPGDMTIQEVFDRSGCSNTLLTSYLFENYLEHRPHLQDVKKISKYLSTSDVLNRFDVRETLEPYVAEIQGMAFASFYTTASPKKFRSFHKPQDVAVAREAAKYKHACSSLLNILAPHCLTSETLLIDFLPLATRVCNSFNDAGSFIDISSGSITLNNLTSRLRELMPVKKEPVSCDVEELADSE